MKSAFLVSAAESFEGDVWRAARSLGLTSPARPRGSRTTRDACC